MNPTPDREQIGFPLVSCEFPWDTTGSLELALLSTFGVAKGTATLVETGELISLFSGFRLRPLQRAETRR